MTYIKKPEKALIPIEDITTAYTIKTLKERIADLSAKKHIPSVALLIEKWENKILEIEKRAVCRQNLVTQRALFAKRVNEYMLNQQKLEDQTEN